MKNPITTIRTAWQKLGPGLVTGASDDDPSGITTYTQAGSQFGLNTLWTAAITFPLMAAIQEMCGRIGVVTKKGIAQVVKEHYPKEIVYLLTLLIVPACILNIGADLAGMGAVANLVFPQISAQIFTFLAAGIIILALATLSYKRIASILKYITMILLVYLVVPFMVKQDWIEVAKATFIPHFEFNKGFISILVALLGTTISPYLFVWEDAMEVEDLEEKERRHKLPAQTATVVASEIKAMRIDNLIGMFFSNFIMFFIILTAGSILFKNGVNDIQTVEQAALSLEPIAGKFAYILFALGIIGTGFLAVPVLAGACAYTLRDTLGLKGGMNSSVSEAKGFYGVIAISVIVGAGLNFFGINPVQALIWTAIVYGLVSPILIGLIIHICNNKKIMGSHTNGKLSNTLSILGFVLMTLACIALAWVNL